MQLFYSVLVLGLFSLTLSYAKSCEDLSDQMCREVWSSKHKGNITYGSERVFLGKTGKSELSQAQRFDLVALIDSIQRLKPDLKNALKSHARKARVHLAKENHDKSWMRQFAILKYEMSNAAVDVAEKRTFQRRPDLKLEGKREDDKTFTDYHELQKDLYDVTTEILNAKYANHPNWKRVERIFGQVQSKLKEIVKTLPVDQQTIQTMQKKIDTVELTLPYQDPRLFGTRDSCGSTELNAFYRLSRNKVTVCAGYFNSLQSEGKIFSTLAHEIAHSIDAATLAFDEFSKSKLAQLMRDVDESKSEMSCSEWSKRKKVAFNEPEGFFKIHPRIEKLNQCHADRSELAPLTVANLSKPSEALASQYLGGYANSYAFTRLAQPEIFKYENLIANEYFDHPERLSAEIDENYMFTPNRWGYFGAISVFMQEYRCQLGRKEVKTTDKVNRAKVFQASLKESERLYAQYLKIYFSYLGREAGRLQPYNLSRPSFENWADWLGQKAFSKFLEKTPKNKRKHMIQAVNAADCRQVGLNTVAPKLVKIEKSFANEEHPESRTRRLQIFNGTVAEAMGCVRGKNLREKYQQCKI